MADGRSRSSTATQTQTASTLAIGKVLLYTTIPSYPDVQSLPAPETTGDYDTKAGALGKAFGVSDHYPHRPSTEDKLLSLRIEREDNGSYQPEKEAGTMVESPCGSLEKLPIASPQCASQLKSRNHPYAISVSQSSASNRNLPRLDSAYYSTKEPQDGQSEIDADIQAKQMRARERVAILRAKVLRTRRIRRDRQYDARHLRENVTKALNNLTRKINELVALNEMSKEIVELHETLQAAQAKLGPAEDACDLIEIRLDEEEDDLELEEDHFYRHNEITAVSVADSQLDHEISPLVKPYAPQGSTVTDLNLESDLMQEYLNKVEEAERLKEDLEYLENDYLRSSGDAAFRKRHGIPISSETAAFLEEYAKLHADMLDDVRDVEQTLLAIRNECLEQGLFSESDYPYEPHDALYEEIQASVEEAQERSPLRVAAQNLNYEERKPDFGDKRDHINSWLLEWTQDSPLDVLMLKEAIYFAYPDMPARSWELDEDQWSELALENWSTDSMGELANKFYKASRMDAITGAPDQNDVTSAGHSGVSSSFRSLDVAIDEERLMRQNVPTSEPLQPSQIGEFDTTSDEKYPQKEKSSQLEEMATENDATPIKQAQERPPDMEPSLDHETNPRNQNKAIARTRSLQGPISIGSDRTSGSPRRSMDLSAWFPTVTSHTVRRAVSFQGPYP